MADLVLLEIKDLHIGFPAAGGGTLAAVRGVSLTVRKGEILGLVGESGSGKSLTGASILGLVPPPGRVTGGAIRLGGRDLLSLDRPAQRSLRGREVSMVFQEPMTALNPVMSVGDQIAEVFRVHRLARGRAARARALAMLQAVKVPDAALRMNEFPHQLSGGMRQRVVIALALACDPALIVADEPTTALDVTIQAQVLSLLLALRQKFHTSIILISHNLGVIARSCDRVAVMYAGRIVETGTASEVFLATRHPYTLALLGATPRRGVAGGGTRPPLKEIPGMVPSLSDLPRGCAFAPRCPRASARCAVDPDLTSSGGSHPVACHHPVGADG